MRRIISHLTGLILLLLTCQSVLAAESTRVLFALEQARSAVNQLNVSSAGNNLVETELATSRRYLQQAETLYKDSSSWIPLRGISEAAEMEVIDTAEMSEKTAKIGLSKIERQIVDRESEQLGKKISEAKEKVRVLEERAAEMAMLKATAGKLGSMEKEIATLKTGQASAELISKDHAVLVKKVDDLQTDKKNLQAQLEAVRLEKATLNGQLEAMLSDKKLDGLQIKKQQERIVELEKELIPLQQNKQAASKSETKLSAAERSADFKSRLSALGALTDITDNSLILIIPRSDLIKTTSRGHSLANDAEKQVEKLMALMAQYPEYRLSLQVFGYGKPTKLEGQKAADQMASILRDFFALRRGVKADTIQASGETTASALFSTKTAEPHRRIELKFTKNP